MPPLQVRDFPPDTYERLRTCAEEEKRSISQQTIVIVERYLAARDAGIPHAQDAFTAPQHMNGADASPQNNWNTPYTYRDEGCVDYAERHRRVLERYAHVPRVPVTSKRPRADVLLKQVREEETL